MSGSAVMSNGVMNDQAGSPATLVPVQGPATHVGTPIGSFSMPYNGCLIAFVTGQSFIADPGLYGAIIAAPDASAAIVWSN